MTDTEEILILRKKLKKYGDTLVFTITKDDSNVFEFEEGKVYDLRIKKAGVNKDGS